MPYKRDSSVLERLLAAGFTYQASTSAIHSGLHGRRLDAPQPQGECARLTPRDDKMVLKDQLKNVARKIVEKPPSEETLSRAVRSRNARTIMFTDDGIIPNHPRWPLIVYRRAVLTNGIDEPEVLIDNLFAANQWGRSWRDTIYDFVHYHSQVHEVLGVARGSAVVEFGGVKGRRLSLQPGDIAILPAGTGHRLIKASRNFLVVGAYPPSGTYDECTDSRDRPDARKRIAKVKKPASDPVYGKTAGIRAIWKVRHK